MKKIITLFLMFFVYSNVSFAQLKPVQYIDSNQILNGFSIQPKSKSQQK
jgi:hypothetical protein